MHLKSGQVKGVRWSLGSGRKNWRVLFGAICNDAELIERMVKEQDEGG
jgi:hypothetical protein